MRFAGNKFQHRQAVARKSEAFKPVTMERRCGLSLPAMVCTRCGMICADVRPDWSPHLNKRHV
jgi:hypothetical protein